MTNEILNIQDFIGWGTEFFTKKKIESPRLNIELMLCKALKCKRIDLYVNFDKPLASAEKDELRTMVKRRAKREPLQYILGEVDFFGLKLLAKSGVLIPRPETEELCELVSNYGFDKDSPLEILDLCSGSGCISLALARYFPNSNVIGVEISSDAIQIAEENKLLNSIENVSFVEADVLKYTKSKKQYDIIVSNPPYVSMFDYNSLEPELKDFEPKIALTDMGDGFKFYETFVELFSSALKPQGVFFLEFGYGQFDKIKNIFENSSYQVEIQRDTNSIERFAIGRKG